MKTYGIIGFPLAHSFSQRYFTEKFLKENIGDCVYLNYPIKTIGELPLLLKANKHILGLNVTIPFKQRVMEFLHDRTNIPEGLSACNCIKVDDGKLLGFNTDIIGFERSLLPLLDKHHTHALVLGNGGAAEAVKSVLRKLGISYQVVSRRLHLDSSLTYQDLDKDVIETHKLIINTTPLGTFPDISHSPEIPYQFLSAGHLLYDLVYNPSKTLFLQKAGERGAATKNGYEMLLLQAEESWRIWNEG